MALLQILLEVTYPLFELQRLAFEGYHGREGIRQMGQGARKR